MNDKKIRDARQDAIRWAQGILKQNNALILDTESTGLDEEAEIVQIGILDLAGNVLLDALIRPERPIQAEASAVHGIGKEALANALAFEYVYGAIAVLLHERHVIAYNVDFDRRMLNQTCQVHSLPRVQAGSWSCAMHRYAEFYGEWNSYHGSFRWQSLGTACWQQNITVNDAHAAVGDCRLTLQLMKAMAKGDSDA